MNPDPREPQSAAVVRMFGAIADRYDLMNRVMTLGMDGRWRRQACEVANIGPGAVVLDVATGTGDLAFELAALVAPTGRVVGLDFADPMLHVARRKSFRESGPVHFVKGDALALPYQDDTFSAVTCAFGLRNFEDRPAALREMVRVVKPGHRVVILELTPAKNALARRYMDDVVPRIGELLARARDAYTYLPHSVQEFPDAMTLGRMMQSVGLHDVTYRLLNVGTVALHWGTKGQPRVLDATKEVSETAGT